MAQLIKKFKIDKIDRFLFSTIEKLENQKMTLTGWLLTFLTIVFLRNFFETFSSKDNLFLAKNWVVFFGNYIGFFLCWLLVIILLIYFLTKENIDKITKLALSGTTLALAVSIFETIFSFIGGGVIRNKYELVSTVTNFSGLAKTFVEYTGWGIGSFFINEEAFNVKIFIFVSIAKIVFLLTILFILKRFFLKTKSIFLGIIYVLFAWCFQLAVQLYFYWKAIGSPFYFSSEHFLENIGPHIIGSLCAVVCSFYVFLKTKSVLKTFFALIFFYMLGFFVSYFPLIFTVLLKLSPTPTSFYGVSNINPNFNWSGIFSAIYFILIFLSANLWFFIYNKEKFLAVWRNIRPLRLVHNLALLGFGFCIAISLAPGPYGVGVLPWSLNFFDSLLLIMASLALLFFWFSAISYDDIFDEKIDKISNCKRPLCQNKLTKEECGELSMLFRGASYFFAAIVGYGFFLLIFLRSLIVYVYSAPPFRLKRFPIIATFLLSLSALFTILAGFVLSPQYTVLDFPKKLMIFILVVFTLGFTAKDIKDYKGDKSDMVYTIPVIFGEKKGKIILGIVALLALFLPVIFFSGFWKILVLPSILAGTLSFWLINRKKYKETPLFLIYFLYGIFFFWVYFFVM